MRTNKEVYLTDNVFVDRFTKIPYKELSLEDEVKYMKKLKLSYYYDVDEEKQEQYIRYYGEIFPEWYERYNNADERTKKRLLNKAIEKSLKYREDFIRNNIRLVVYLAKFFQRYDNLENLCQEGMIGLIKSVKHYNFESGNKFSSFASVSIKRSIIRYIQDHSNNIRIPNKKFSEMNRELEIEYRLFQEKGKKPTDEEIMKEMGINEKQLYDLRRCRYITRMKSLDEPMEDNDTVLGDLIVDNDSQFEEKINNNLMGESLIKLIENLELPYYYKNILYMRYGINGFNEQLTYQEIASFYKISKSRVQQIEKKVLKMLKEKLLLQQEQEAILENGNKEKNKEDIKDYKKISTLKERLYNSEFRYIRESLLCSNLKVLGQTQRYILSKVYGLNCQCAMDSEIARVLDISVDEVNRLETKSLERLCIRIPKNINKYRNF